MSFPMRTSVSLSFTGVFREHTSAAIVLNVLFIWWNAVSIGSIFRFLKPFCWFLEKQDCGELTISDPSMSEADVWRENEEGIDDCKGILQFVSLMVFTYRTRQRLPYGGSSSNSWSTCCFSVKARRLLRKAAYWLAVARIFAKWQALPRSVSRSHNTFLGSIIHDLKLLTIEVSSVTASGVRHSNGESDRD